LYGASRKIRAHAFESGAADIAAMAAANTSPCVIAIRHGLCVMAMRSMLSDQ